MFDDPLSLPVRAAVAITSVVFVVVGHRALFRRASSDAARAGALIAGGALVVGVAFSHVPVFVDMLGRVFPIGFALGLAAAIASLFHRRARRAFDQLDDAEVRILLSFRAIYGGLLLALGAIGHLPVSFALAAGLGDLAVTWLTFALGARLSADGPRWARALVHGVGLADMVTVVVLAVTVVAPWSAAQGNVTTAVTLPWLAVPFMFALNAHGVRKAARGAEVVGDGSQPAGRVRSAPS